MSLISTFYIGDSDAIASALVSTNPAELEALQKMDFSGGVRSPFLMMQDFERLFKMAGAPLPRNFEKFIETVLAESEERGTYLLRADCCAAFASIDDHVIQKFSEQWNEARKVERSQPTKRGCLGSLAFWKFFWGLGLGILASYLTTKSLWSVIAAILFWMVFAGGAALLDHRFLKPVAHTSVDWVSPIKELQTLMRSAASTNLDVVYHWSL